MKLVLTGGPSGGKTTMALAIMRCYGDMVAMIPEAASILFGGGFRRSNLEEGVKHQQKAIYRVQVEHEAIYNLEFPGRLLVCDRGTLDGQAYWPRGDSSFLTSIGTSREAELTRYQWVIHLETAEQAHYDQTNKLRKESHPEANHINERVKEAWAGHPQRIIIPATTSFGVKVNMTLTIVEQILAGIPYSKICQNIVCG